MDKYKKDGLSGKEIKERVKGAIQEYVDTCNKKGKRIESKKQIIDGIREECEEASILVDSSLYRYLDEMNCQQIVEGKFDFVIEDDRLSLGDILQYKKYNKIACFFIENPEYTNLLAYLVNQHYKRQDKSDVIHCIALGEILLCLYYYKKNDGNSITRKEIKKDVSQVVKSYTIYAK
jgi:hypothetical protein